MTQISRGEVWLVNLNPVKGREQAGKRPCLVISVDLFNNGSADLVIALPITSKNKRIPFHVKVDPPEGGLKIRSYVKCEDVRSISKERLDQRWGRVSQDILVLVEDRLKILMDL
ncbi:MAG: type II toxin-antitoxin system PemK/MazF family toxin [Cyanobacteria bacterium J06642_11]